MAESDPCLAAHGLVVGWGGSSKASESHSSHHDWPISSHAFYRSFLDHTTATIADILHRLERTDIVMSYRKEDYFLGKRGEVMRMSDLL